MWMRDGLDLLPGLVRHSAGDADPPSSLEPKLDRRIHLGREAEATPWHDGGHHIRVGS